MLATGVPDALLGERIHVAVKPRGGGLDPATLRAWAAERLERFKVPDAMHLVEEQPARAAGKANRGELRRRLSAASS